MTKTIETKKLVLVLLLAGLFLVINGVIFDASFAYNPDTETSESWVRVPVWIRHAVFYASLIGGCMIILAYMIWLPSLKHKRLNISVNWFSGALTGILSLLNELAFLVAGFWLALGIAYFSLGPSLENIGLDGYYLHDGDGYIHVASSADLSTGTRWQILFVLFLPFIVICIVGLLQWAYEWLSLYFHQRKMTAEQIVDDDFRRLIRRLGYSDRGLLIEHGKKFFDLRIDDVKRWADLKQDELP